MKLNPYCIRCQLDKQEERIRGFEDKKKKMDYMRYVLKTLYEAGDESCAPAISHTFRKYYSRYWNVPEKDFTDIKREYNSLMLNLEDRIYKEIKGSDDPLKAALLYARTGNYIDYAALPDVNPDTLLQLLFSDLKGSIDNLEYSIFRSELESAGTLLYITDNCGEIVLDKLVIRLLNEKFPQLRVTVLVRGGQTVNDADMTDAEMCGLTQLVPVISSGNQVPGTYFPLLSDESRAALETADMIISKGQGNFETLHDCGLNIYYLFLCKCQYFQDMFHAEKLQGMFVNERRL